LKLINLLIKVSISFVNNNNVLPAYDVI
jgi:hypothetical protein